MKLIPTVFTVCLTIAAACFCWHILSSDGPEWLRVQTPGTASRDYPFTIKVILTKPEPGTFLDVNLHWMDGNKISHGYLSGGRTVMISGNRYIYETSLKVPVNEQASYVFPVIFLSHDGTWGNKFAAAIVEPVPVSTDGPEHSDLQMKTRQSHDFFQHEPVLQPESRKLRFIIAGLWFTVAFIGFAGCRRIHTGGIAAMALLSAGWELFNSSAVIAGMLRNLAYGMRFYNERKEPQQVITILIIIATVALVLHLVSSALKPDKIIQITAITVFWGISVASLLSLHKIDTVLSKSVAGIQAGQLSRLAAALACLAAIIFSIIFRGKKVRVSS